jgi:transposase-like protein
MRKRKKVMDAQAVIFKRLHGVKPETFEKMLSILQKKYDTLHQKGGKPPKLTVEDKLRITLIYLREYRTMDSIAAEYGVCKGTVCLSIQWVEDTLVEDGAFALPGKETLKRKSASIRSLVIDVTESPINRPQKDQKAYYSGKKTAHAENTGHN